MKKEIIIFYGNTRMAFFLQGGQIESENPEIYIGRRKSSINVVSGMRFEMRDGQIVNVIIDLREEKNLRSDLINVGGIKKPREQKVYPACFFRNMQSARIFYIFSIQTSKE